MPRQCRRYYLTLYSGAKTEVSVNPNASSGQVWYHPKETDYPQHDAIHITADDGTLIAIPCRAAKLCSKVSLHYVLQRLYLEGDGRPQQFMESMGFTLQERGSTNHQKSTIRYCSRVFLHCGTCERLFLQNFRPAFVIKVRFSADRSFRGRRPLWKCSRGCNSQPRAKTSQQGSMRDNCHSTIQCKPPTNQCYTHLHTAGAERVGKC